MRLAFEPETFGIGLRVYLNPAGVEINIAWWTIDIHIKEKEA